MQEEPTNGPGQGNGQQIQNPRIEKADRIIAISGYLLIVVSVLSFGAIATMKLWESFHPPEKTTLLLNWIDLVQKESGTISLIVIALLAASLGKKLLTAVRLTEAHTFPPEDYPLISKAVMEGNAGPIDQYVRLRSLSGISGNFTKMGLTGLPLTTVSLTLIFALLAIMPIERAKDFLELAKLTLGAFIGSFVQRQVEQRRGEPGDQQKSFRAPSLPA